VLKRERRVRMKRMNKRHEMVDLVEMTVVQEGGELHLLVEFVQEGKEGLGLDESYSLPSSLPHQTS
jgi:hypothetical protein